MKIEYSAIYLRAAQMVDNEEDAYSCIALSWIAPFAAEDDLLDLYRLVFCDGLVLSNMEWECVVNLSSDAERKRVRVLMLCLMAECWGDFV